MGHHIAIEISDQLRTAIESLLKAAEYAVDTSSDRWDFAVSIESLQRSGATETDFRWLVKRGFVDHGIEITREGQHDREFRKTGHLTFAPATCFVLTDDGYHFAGTTFKIQLGKQSGATLGERAGSHLMTSESAQPRWDGACRRLWLDESLVKRYRWPAMNQEAILCAFEEEGWPERIDDPLPPHPDQDSKRRLADTIKCLNRKQINELIHFRGDGTGEGVIWERAGTEMSTEFGIHSI